MIHLHVHTKYSLLDGMMHIEDIAERLKEIGQDTIAITEHGNLYSNVEAFSKLSKAGIKVINGCEMYICDDVEVANKDSKYHHLVLLCKNEQGRLNLNWLVSQSTLHKYYGRPRIDFKMLEEHREGLICLSACMAGEVSRALMDGDVKLAETIALKYKSLFGNDYYIEYQAHLVDEQQNLNLQLIELANKLSIKYVVTCDSHYVRPEDEKYHNIFIQIGSQREAGEIYKDCYLQSEQDVIDKCVSTKQYTQQAIATTHEIADKCENTIPLSAPIIPHVPVPNGYKSELQYLQYLCNQGFKDKGFATWTEEQWRGYLTDQIYKDDGTIEEIELVKFDSADDIRKRYVNRARYEMNALKEMGFEGYYLLVHSYVNAAKRRGIARGSGGGSLLAYLCGIVDIDPIKYGLYFERFIDVGALDLLKDGTITKKELKIPDFDVDFSPKDRDKVMDFIVDRYEEENVVALGQFSYIWAKGAIKDIGRVLGIPFEVTNEMTKNLDNETIEEALDLGLLDSYKDEYPQLFEYAAKLSGLPKSYGVHPCGKVIATREATYFNATEYNDNKKTWVLQGDMHSADDLGLVKIDLLGLRTLDVIYDTLEMIGKDYAYIAPHRLNMNDPKVWNEFAQGNTDCIFQFESTGMKHMLKDMKCDSMENLSAANALYRPGSKDYIPNYVNRKNGVEEITYLHQDLKNILGNSYGIIVFQEQLIEIGRLAGLRNPDELRKATAKKKPELMAKIEPELKSGLMKRGWTQEQVDELWTTILQFARYSFNKSHSSAYGLTAYITMYLKVYHTNEFFAACINSYDGDIDGVVKTIKEAKRMGVDIKFDKWQNITGETVCHDNAVWLGTNTMKGFGKNVAVALNELGKNHYDNFISFLVDASTNSNIDKSQLESLIILGWFNQFGGSGKLSRIYKLFADIYGRKQFAKNKCNIPYDIISKFCKETEKQYREIDYNGLLSYMCDKVEDFELPLEYRLKIQQQVYGYISYIDLSRPNTAVVMDLNTKYSTFKAQLYRVSFGDTITVKLKKKSYEQMPIAVGQVINYRVESKPGWTKLDNGEWKQDYSKTDLWLSYYTLES
jgi:DNA polymerase-3 subunit alpha